MANELKVRIEQVSREKNLDPDVVVRAIEDAILQAAKRYFNNDEDLRSSLQPRDRGHRRLRGQGSGRDRHRRGDRDLSRGGAPADPRGRAPHGDRVPEADRRSRTHRRAGGQAGHLPEGPRRRARQRHRRVRAPPRRRAERRDQASGRHRLRHRPRPHRGRAARARSRAAPRTTRPATASVWPSSPFSAPPAEALR
jgi:hypothetical protein